MDFSAQLIAKRPQITVDRNGGLFPLSPYHPRAHVFISGDDPAPDRVLSGNTVRR